MTRGLDATAHRRGSRRPTTRERRGRLAGRGATRARAEAGLRLLLLVVPVTLATALGGTDAVAAKQPFVQLQTTVLVPGTSVGVSGSGWPAHTTLQAVLCGDNAVDGSGACAEAAAVTMTPGPSGVIDGRLQVVAPPAPCPCVVVFSGLETGYSYTLPVEVLGVPSAPVTSVAPGRQGPTLQATARVTGGGSLGSFFGAPASRTLIVTLVNAGPSPVEHPVVSASWGRPGGTQHVIATPRILPLGPSATRVVRIPFQLDAFSHGDFAVNGRVTGAWVPVRFGARTSTAPWGLLIVAVLALQLFLLGIRNAVRRRMRRRDAMRDAVAAAMTPPPRPPGAARVAVIPGPVMVGGVTRGSPEPVTESMPETLTTSPPVAGALPSVPAGGEHGASPAAAPPELAPIRWYAPAPRGGNGEQPNGHGGAAPDTTGPPARQPG